MVRPGEYFMKAKKKTINEVVLRVFLRRSPGKVEASPSDASAKIL